MRHERLQCNRPLEAVGPVRRFWPGICYLFLVFAAALPVASRAQSPPLDALQFGVRARVTDLREDLWRAQGIVERISPDSVWVRIPNRGVQRIPLDGSARIDVVVGRKHPLGPSLLIGAALGLVGGLAEIANCDDTDSFVMGCREIFAGVALMGTAAGLLVGLAIWKDDWATVPLQGRGRTAAIRLNPSGRGRVGLAVQLR